MKKVLNKIQANCKKKQITPHNHDHSQHKWPTLFNKLHRFQIFTTLTVRKSSKLIIGILEKKIINQVIVSKFLKHQL